MNDKDTKKINDTSHHLLEEGKEKVEEMYNQTKEKASELYHDGMKKVCDVHENLHEHIKEYSEELTKTVHEKPLTSLLIAGGIGFILAALLRK